MRTCPWCGRPNLNVYAYCQGCGRGFDTPEGARALPGFWAQNLGRWLAGSEDGVSPWPIVAAILALLFGPLLAWNASTDSDVALPFAGGVAGAAVAVLLAWLLSSLAAGRPSEPVRPAALVESVFTVAAPVERDVLTRMLRRVPGVQSVRIALAERQATIAVVHSQDTDRDALETVISRHAGAAVAAFEPRTFEWPAVSSVRMGFGGASVAFGAIGLSALAGAIAVIIFAPGDSVSSAAPATPSDGPLTVVARDLKFDQRQLRVAAGDTVTLTFDNRDAGVPHNIEFFASETPGEGDVLAGCTEGCAEDGATSTPVENGPVVQTLTFVAPAPGSYGYWCIVHPTTMTGVLVAQ